MILGSFHWSVATHYMSIIEYYWCYLWLPNSKGHIIALNFVIKVTCDVDDQLGGKNSGSWNGADAWDLVHYEGFFFFSEDLVGADVRWNSVNSLGGYFSPDIFLKILRKRGRDHVRYQLKWFYLYQLLKVTSPIISSFSNYLLNCSTLEGALILIKKN